MVPIVSPPVEKVEVAVVDLMVRVVSEVRESPVMASAVMSSTVSEPELRVTEPLVRMTFPLSKVMSPDERVRPSCMVGAERVSIFWVRVMICWFDCA